jgi:hypothetical protein
MEMKTIEQDENKTVMKATFHSFFLLFFTSIFLLFHYGKI